MDMKRPLTTSIALIAGVVIFVAAGGLLGLPVPLPSQSAQNATGQPLSTRVAVVTPAPTARPSVAPAPTATPTLAPTAAPTPSWSGTGSASWYCNADPARGPISRCTAGFPDLPTTTLADGTIVGVELLAAAGPELRTGNWRGRVVTVFGPVGFSVVELVDFCACSQGLIDVYADVFAIVCGPLSHGRCEVSISW